MQSGLVFAFFEENINNASNGICISGGNAVNVRLSLKCEICVSEINGMNQ